MPNDKTMKCYSPGRRRWCLASYSGAIVVLLAAITVRAATSAAPVTHKDTHSELLRSQAHRGPSPAAHQPKVYAEFYRSPRPFNPASIQNPRERQFIERAMEMEKTTLRQADRDLVHHPRDPQLYFQQGQSLTALGRFREAKEAFRRMARFSTGKEHEDAIKLVRDTP